MSPTVQDEAKSKRQEKLQEEPQRRVKRRRFLPVEEQWGMEDESSKCPPSPPDTPPHSSKDNESLRSGGVQVDIRMFLSTDIRLRTKNVENLSTTDV